MAFRSLKSQMQDISDLSEKRMIAVMRQSLQDVVNNAQTPTAKGGRMRVDTGFLRASGQASNSGLPQGPSRPAKDAKPGQYATDETATVLVLANLQLGQTFFFGWTANYARYRELYDGFLEGALQHWGRIVAFNADRARQGLKK